MDRDLLRQSLSYHGESLLSLLTCEQNENPDFTAIASDLSKAVCERQVADASRSTIVEQFISRKADLLFSPLWKSAVPVEDDWQDASCEPYAIMPPLEQFMEVSFEERRDLFFRDVERGDVIIGRINSIRDFGFFVTLICTYSEIERDIEDLELTALCPIRDVPSNGNHDDPLSYYQVGDLIRAGLKDVDRYHGKLTVSLHPSSLAPRHSSLKLGVISREDLPIHYCRGERVASDGTETYERVLESSLGFSNPSNVDVLLAKLGVLSRETKCCSMMRGLQSKHFQEEDFAVNIRKKQSASWALKCVKAGVDHFKSGRHVEAMNEYNKALEIDTNNVEALVARGALYATKGSLVKAISDFEVALESCPTHRNAKKYLCQTLVERGGQLEEEEKLVTAEGLYKKALTLDEHFQDATEALRKLQMRIQKSLKLKEEEAAKELEKTKNVETSAEKLRKILKEEKRMKRKRKRSSSSSSMSSSSSSSSSASSSSSSSAHRKSKKKKRKHRRSSHSDKKRHRRTSSSRHGRFSDEEERGKEEEEEEEEWYPEPANTSASFMNLKHPVSGLFDDESSQAKATRSLSLGSTSIVDALDDSRGRFEDDLFECGPAMPTKAREPRSDRRVGLKDHDVNGREKGPSVHYTKSEAGSSSAQEPARSGTRRHSSSSTSSEYSRKSDQQGHRYANVPSHHSEKVEKRDGRRSEGHARDSKRHEDSSQNGRRSSEGGPKKELPSNLQDIFNRIARFEKEKGLKHKK
ncbi:hypothetical protein AALO_G00120810 [Alosa alosa]|uniref:S1 motif domain-containing protein n=1 Tax=Alosa alosa TaxID=278164 RepID=A0AAV6GQ23_9TELE|nr:tetratricopeptide repeat protein 14 isoform X1 [Alosa alosa]XP_048109284.1 tetratricopeptide repeat protein 14 isoform X1 [Alosa alosa]KAG5275482.1 hypothetical protein AALO_G00120810 [Alosa alosa]